MKNLFLLSLLILMLSNCGNFSRLSNLSPAFEHARYYDKVIAILPFEVVNRYNRMPKNATIKSLKAIEREEAMIMQRDLYRYCLRGIGKDFYSIRFQNYEETNKLLSSKEIKYEKLKKIPKRKLAEMLGVDAVIFGKVTQNKTKWNNDIGDRLFTSSKNVSAVVTIHNRKNRRAIWKYTDGVSFADDNTFNSLSRKLLRRVATQIPYQKSE